MRCRGFHFITYVHVQVHAVHGLPIPPIRPPASNSLVRVPLGIHLARSSLTRCVHRRSLHSSAWRTAHDTVLLNADDVFTGAAALVVVSAAHSNLTMSHSIFAVGLELACFASLSVSAVARIESWTSPMRSNLDLHAAECSPSKMPHGLHQGRGSCFCTTAHVKYLRGNISSINFVFFGIISKERPPMLRPSAFSNGAA